jgi:hypothetical protein
MTFLLAVFVFPLLLAAVSLGSGLLVERIGGWRVPSLLLAPLGFAAVIGVSQATTWVGPIAPLTPWALLAVAIAGFVVGRTALGERWHARRGGWWLGFAAGAGAYLIASMPVLLAGRATFPGYLLDTTGSVQLMGTERLLSEGHSWAPNGTAGYGLQLYGYFGTGYPSGAHSAFGGLGRLVGVDYIWLYAPYLAAMLGLTALPLTWIARRIGLPQWAAAASGCVAAVPALVYAYLLQGSIKEIVLLPTLMLLGALVLLAREQLRGVRAIVPLAVTIAAGASTIGLSFAPWALLSALAILVLGIGALGPRDRWPKAVAARTAVLIVAVALLALPTAGDLTTQINLTRNVSSANATAVADPGNLLRPLLDVQALGVWIGPSHRVDPGDHLRLTYTLIGVVAVAVVLGLVWLYRRRNWAVLAWVALSVVTWLALDQRATTWTAAKLLVLLSPVVLLIAFVGAFGRLGSRRVEGLLLAGAIAGGVLLSDASLYHATGLAPTQRFDELRQIGERYAGVVPTAERIDDQRVTLVPDFDEYSLYLLREMAPDSPGNARRLVPWALRDGNGIGYGQTVDVDALQQDGVQRADAIVVRRSGFKSRPPGNFRRDFHGDYYDVWRRDAGTAAPLLHEGLGDGQDPAATPSCRLLRRFARDARAAGAKQLTAAVRPPSAVADPARQQLSGTIVVNDGAPPLASFTGPGDVRAVVDVPRAGRYRLWVEGVTGRELVASVDGRAAGAVQAETGGAGNALRFDELELTTGRHTIELHRGGGGLAPGDADATYFTGIALEPSGADDGELRTVPVAAWRTLCGGSYDWLEAR